MSGGSLLRGEAAAGEGDGDGVAWPTRLPCCAGQGAELWSMSPHHPEPRAGCAFA